MLRCVPFLLRGNAGLSSKTLLKCRAIDGVILSDVQQRELHPGQPRPDGTDIAIPGNLFERIEKDELHSYFFFGVDFFVVRLSALFFLCFDDLFLLPSELFRNKQCPVFMCSLFFMAFCFLRMSAHVKEEVLILLTREAQNRRAE